jgi:hypothetical protein
MCAKFLMNWGVRGVRQAPLFNNTVVSIAMNLLKACHFVYNGLMLACVHNTYVQQCRVLLLDVFTRIVKDSF